MWRFFSRLREFRDALRQRAKGVSTRQLHRGRSVLFLTVLSLVAARPAYAFEFEFDNILNLLAEGAFQIAAVLTSAIVLLIDVMVPVMTYNEFTNNHVVSAGWAIVRDTVNMFFVVVLIIIAFGTIFGHSRFKWQQQVPQLMIMALVINFSKTLCGIMIDFGQVIMLTFANALREIAAGNIIQLFGLNQLYAISNNSSVIDEGRALEAFDFFAAGVLSVFMVMGVLVILFFLVAILLFRIVGLWVLVVLAPMAWFMKGAEGVISSDFYKNWWAEFKCLVAIGPVLTFFLWLTLAVAAAGNIAEKSGFDVSSGSNNADFYSQALQLDNFMSFLIGCILMFASFDAAAQVCSGSKKASGFMQKYALSPAQGFLTKMAKSPRTMVAAAPAAAGAGLKLAGTGAAYTARGAMGAAGLAKAGVAAVPGSKFARDVAAKTKMDRLSQAERLRKRAEGRGSGAIGRWRADRERKKADILSQSAGQGVEEQKGKLKDMTRQRKTDMAKRFLDSPPSSVAGEAQATALYEEMLGDSQMQKDLGQDRVKKMHEQYGDKYKKMFGHDSAKMGAVKSFEKANVHYSGAGLDSIDSYEDVKGLSDAALQNPEVREHLKKIQSTHLGDDKKPLSAYDALVQGREGNKKAAAIGLKPGDRFATMSKDDLRLADVGELGSTGSTMSIRQGIDLAMADGDTKRAESLISSLASRYTAEGTSDADRLDLLQHMNGLRAEFDTKKGRVTAGGRGNAKMLKRLNALQEVAEGRVPPPMDLLDEGQSGDAYGAKMNLASEGQRQQAAEHLSTQQSIKNQELSERTKARDELVSGRRSGIEDSLRKLTESLEQARVKIDKDLLDKTESIRAEYVRARQQADHVKTQPGTPKKWVDEAEEKANALLAQLNAAKSQSVMPDARKRAVEKDEVVVKLKAQIEAKAAELKEFNPEEVEEVKELNQRIAALQTHLSEIETARDKMSL